jgi:hypothetical protein
VFISKLSSCDLRVCVKPLLFTLFRPKLEYSINLWSPNLFYLIDLIESIRRNFTENITSIPFLPYSKNPKVSTFKLETLHLKLTNHYKILNGYLHLLQVISLNMPCYIINMITHASFTETYACNYHHFSIEVFPAYIYYLYGEHDGVI